MIQRELKKPSKNAGWHCVFKNKKEFEDHFLKKEGSVPPLVEDWRESRIGDWVLADDGGVIQILRRNPMSVPGNYDRSKKVIYYVGTVIGTFICRKKIKMDTDPNLRKNPCDRSRFFVIKDQNRSTHESIDRIRGKKETTYKEIQFITYLLAAHIVAIKNKDDNFVSDEILEMAYKAVYKTTNKTFANYKARLLFKQERIQMALKEEVVKIATDMGIDHKYILKLYDDLATKSKDEKVKFQAAEKLGDIVGTNPEETKTVSAAGYLAAFSSKDMLEAEKGTQQISETEEVE